MAVLFKLEIHTPYRLFFSDNAEAIILNLADGEAGIYAHHSPLTALVAIGVLRIKNSAGKWRSAFVSEGLLEVKEHKNVMIVDDAEWAEEIDKERALLSKQQAEKALSEANFKFEIDSAKAKLRRAECRLKVLELIKQ